jgi:rod shape-determining protein MreC
MESLFTRYKNLLVLSIVLLVQVFGLAIQVKRPAAVGDSDDKRVRVLRYWVVSLVTPPEAALHWFGSGIRGMWSNYINLRGVRQQNHDLKSELDRLRIEQAGLIEDAKQGERLQQQLNFKRDYIYKTTIAQVIGTSGTDQSRVIYIDKGSHDGIKPDMAVITPDGIVGKVKDVFPRTSQVLEISDQTSGAGVLLETTRIRGILRGNVYGQPQIVNVMPDDRIKAGEKVVTSGGDQVFPRGLPVGIVDHVVNDPEREPYIAVMIRPGANLSRLEEVLVITSTGDQMPKQEQADLAISSAEGIAARQREAAAVSAGLPSVKDPTAPNAQSSGTLSKADADKQAAAEKQALTGIPVPIKAVQPLHPDRYTPLTVPPANELVPGQAPPRTTPTHSSEASAPAISAAKPTVKSEVPATDDGNPAPPKPAKKPKAPVLDENGDPVKTETKPVPKPAEPATDEAPKPPAAAPPSGMGQ